MFIGIHELEAGKPRTNSDVTLAEIAACFVK
jgi:hypothetical protein